MGRKATPVNHKVADSAGHATVYLYGRHAIEAALANPGREKIRLHAAPPALRRLEGSGALPAGLAIERADRDELDRLVGAGTAHQGMVLEVRPLPGRHPEDLAPRPERPHNLVLALDHITDPNNVGAIFRSAAAFSARGILTTRDRAPGESGALAKAASGALEMVPWVRVVNLAAGLEKLKDLGYWRLGLEATAPERLDAVDPGSDVVLVLGAEDKGLRPRTRKCCDFLARLPVSEAIESLNVSAAAAVALYALCGPDVR